MPNFDDTHREKVHWARLNATKIIAEETSVSTRNRVEEEPTLRPVASYSRAEKQAGYGYYYLL